MQKKFIIYVVAIIVVLVIVFLSQQSYFKALAKTLISGATNQAGSYAALYPKISGGVEDKTNTIKTAVNQEKNKISENIGQKVSNYFSGIANSVLHPGTPQNCQP